MTGLMPLSGIGDFFGAIMAPLYAAISAVIVFAHWLWSHLFDPDSGLAWVLSIISLTIIVRTLLIPLFIRQINSARNMQLIQPKMKELQDKYGADRNRLGIETQKLMKEEGVNPMASCFPMLLQLPIFWALYRVLYAAAQNPDSPLGYLFVHNPELVKSLNGAYVFGASLSQHFWLKDWSQFGATQVAAIIMILAMAATFFITQKQLMGKNMPPEAQTGQMAQQQKMMLYLFPVMYLFMGMAIPVGVLVYWVTSNLWTLVQQWLLIRNNPTPGTPAFIEWEERMRAKGRDPEAIQAERRAKRSKAPKQGTSRAVTPTGRAGANLTSGPNQAAGSNSSAGDSGGSSAKNDPTTGPSTTPPGNAVVRQQIQRQQPARQSRASRSVPKPK